MTSDCIRWATCLTKRTRCKKSCRLRRLRSRCLPAIGEGGEGGEVVGGGGEVVWGVGGGAPSPPGRSRYSLFYPQALRSMDESMRAALDKAKTQASQSAAALAQAQARETILAADVECKVFPTRAHSVAWLTPPPPPPPLPLPLLLLLSASVRSHHALLHQRTRGNSEAAQGGGEEGQHGFAPLGHLRALFCCRALKAVSAAE